MKEQIFSLIAKYALLLAGSYFISMAFERMVFNLDLFPENDQFIAYRQFSHLGLAILLNIIIAIMINRDVERFGIKTKYLTLATLVYRPLGVFCFLLYMFLQYMPQHSATDERQGYIPGDADSLDG